MTRGPYRAEPLGAARRLHMHRMRFNPVSFIFVPGAVLAGYLIDGAYGAVMGLTAWAVVVAAATGISFLMQRHRRRQLDRAGDDIATDIATPKRSQILPRFFPYRARR